MPTAIKISLSEASISEAIAKLEKYRDKVDGLGTKVVNRLAEDGKTNAQEVAMFMNAYDTGALVNGIVTEYSDKKARIHSTAPHSAYVEMGTGIVGASAPNGNSYASGWEYDVNNHGEAGWTYYLDGVEHWTQGMPSRPFMYETSQMMREAVEYIAKEEFESEG